MPQHQITINWQFKPTEDDSTHLTLNNILGQPNTDARGKSASEDLVRGNHRISKHSLAECLRKNGTVDISIIEAYLEILCAYHNEKHPVAKNKLPKYINLGHSFFDKLSQRPSPNNPNRGLKWGSQRLHEIAPDLEKNDRRASLMDVEHLLVPVMPKFDSEKHPEFTDLNHVALLIVSPRIKLIEYFDSRYENGDKFIYLMLEYLAYEVGGGFKRGEWSHRQNQGPAQQLTISIGSDEDTAKSRIQFYSGNDGPIHAAIHAWNCLFGLSVYVSHGARFNVHEDILKKRQRMVVDICANQIILEDEYDFANNENLVPTVIHNYYLGITRNEWGDWVLDRRLGQPFWSSDRSGAIHLSSTDKTTSMQYYTWAVSYGRPRCGKTPEEEGTNGDGSLKYPQVRGTIRGLDRRRELLVDICAFLEVVGKEEKYEEREGWTEKILMRAILAYIDENMDGFNKLWCEAQPDERTRGEEKKEDKKSGFWNKFTPQYITRKAI